MRILNTEVPCRVSHKASAGRNASELKAAVKRLTRNDKSITDLTLSWALIADEGCRVLAASLLYNTVLTKLDLHYNDITPFGATALAHCLKTNTTLLSLDLSYNGAGDPGAYAFSRALRENTTLVDLNVSHNSVSAPMMAALQEDILKNRKNSACWTAAGLLGQNVPNALVASTLIQGGARDRTAADRSQEEGREPESTVSTAAARRAGNARFQEAYLTTFFPPVKRKKAPLKMNKYSMDLV